MTILRSVISGLTMLLLLACSSSPVESPRYYLLATPSDSDNAAHLQSITVNIPAYLNQLGMVIVSEQRQVNVANFNLWAEPLDEGIERYFRNTLSDVSAELFASLTVNVNYFHGNDTGSVLLDAGWVLSTNCADPLSGRFNERLQQEATGYVALAATQARLLELMGSHISEAATELASVC